jgi:hypothetical protein
MVELDVQHDRRGRAAGLAIAAALVGCAIVAGACGSEDDAGDAGLPPRPTLPDAVTTSGAGATAELDGEPIVAVRTLPPGALSAENLESAGVARAEDGSELQMARASGGAAEPWELVSPADDGWRVWQPRVVLDVLEDAGAGATLVSVEAVDWPDACLGAAEPDEVCALVVTPGYRVIVQRAGTTIEYHTARTSTFRRAGA